MIYRVLILVALSMLISCQGEQNRVEELPLSSPVKAEKSSDKLSAEKLRPEGYGKLKKQCPDMDEATIMGILEPNSSNRPDFDYYARSYCVSHAEAKRRLALQVEWTSGETAQMVHELMTEITKNEADTFAGHWIQHTPSYAMAIAFTQDAKKTLAKYTDDPIFVAVDMPGASQKTVERNQFRIMAMLEELGIPYSSANRNYKTGLFEVQLSVDKEDYIRDLASKGEIDLPNWVKFKTPPLLPHPIPAPAIAPERLKAFPQYKHRTEFEVRTSVGVPDRQGTLSLHNGCLAFQTDEGVKTILWQNYHAPDLTDAERVGVMSRYDGETIFAGEDVLISGLQPGIAAQAEGNNNKPENWTKVADDTDGACPPPYVLVEGLTSVKKYRKARLDAKVKAYMESYKISREEALKEVQKAEKKAKELSDFIDDIKETRSDIIAGAFAHDIGNPAFSTVYAGYGTKISPTKVTLFVKGDIDKANIVPPHLMESVGLQSVPRSLADGDKDIAFLKEKLGDSAEVDFNFYDGSIAIYNVTDLKPLSELKISMGDEWPEHYKLDANLEATASSHIYFGPATILERYKLQQHPSYQPILDYAEEKFPKTDYFQIDQAILNLLSHGLTDLNEIKRLEAIGFGPLTAELDYQSDSHKIKQAIFSEAIVTAEPIKIETYDPQDDGYRSTVTFRVKERLKGPLQSEQIFKLRMRSGEDEKARHIKSPGEIFLLPGFGTSFVNHKDWILFISHEAYEIKAAQVNYNGPFWILAGHALPGRNNQYPWFGEMLTPAQMRERIKGMDTPENHMAYANSLPRPKAADCHIKADLPAEGLGETVRDNIMEIEGLTVKPHPDKTKSYLGCDHEGPQSQQCIIEDGGYITWLEDGQRKHIKAEGGLVSVWLMLSKGVRCGI